jgi:cell division protease FtsH
MASLVRNLFIFFIIAVLSMLMALFWFLEHRLPSQDYSQVIERLNNNQISKFEFTGNRVVFTDRDNRSFLTTVPDVNNFLERIQDENIRIVVKEDRFNLIYVTVISIFLIVLSWWSGGRYNQKKKKKARLPVTNWSNKEARRSADFRRYCRNT